MLFEIYINQIGIYTPVHVKHISTELLSKRVTRDILSQYPTHFPQIKVTLLVVS